MALRDNNPWQVPAIINSSNISLNSKERLLKQDNLLPPWQKQNLSRFSKVHNVLNALSVTKMPLYYSLLKKATTCALMATLWDSLKVP